MKTSNLAERLEQFEATIDSLRLTPEPGTRQIVAKAGPEVADARTRPSRRAARVRAIEIREQGLRAFRIF